MPSLDSFGKKYGNRSSQGFFSDFSRQLDEERRFEQRQKRINKKVKKYDSYANKAIQSPALPSLLQALKKRAKEGDKDARIKFNTIQELRGGKKVKAKTPSELEKVLTEAYKPRNKEERQVKKEAQKYANRLATTASNNNQVAGSTQLLSALKLGGRETQKRLGTVEGDNAFEKISDVARQANQQFLGAPLRAVGSGVELIDTLVTDGKAKRQFDYLNPQAREGSLGQRVGQAEKVGLDLGLSLISGSAAYNALRGTATVGRLAQAGKAGKLASSVISEVGGGIPSSLTYAALQGKKGNVGEELGYGAAFDVGAAVLPPALSTTLRGGKRLAGPGIDAVKNTLRSLDESKLDRKLARLKSIQDVGRSGDTTEDLVAGLIRGADVEKNKYKKNVLQKFFQKGKETFNPTTELRKIDKLNERIAKREGRTWNRGTDSLEAAYDDVSSSNLRADDSLTFKTSTGDTAIDVFKRHGDDVEEFNVYRNAIADKLARAKTNGKTKFQRNVTDEQLDAIIARYEKLNPNARKDILTLNETINNARAVSKKAGGITDELDARLGTSKDYTPVAAVATKDNPKVPIGGRSAVSGKQTFVKEATGADAKLDTTFEPIQAYIRGAYRNAAQAKLSQGILDAHNRGLIKGSKIISEPGAKATKTDLRRYSKDVKKTAEKLERKLKITKKQARALQSELNSIQKEARGTVERGLKKAVKGQMLPTERPIGENIRGTIEQILQADRATLNRLNKKFLNREPKLAAKLDQIIKAQDEVEVLKSQARGARQAALEIVDDPTKNIAVVRGLDEEGKSFTLKVPPEFTRLLKGTDITPNHPIMKLALGVQRLFQVTWTGFVNPVFNFLINPIYDASANVNALVDNPSAFFKSLSPDSFGKALKGLKSTDSWQKELKRAGAVTQGGSQMPQDIAKGINSVMSKRSLKSRTGYLVKNPKEALDILDQFSGKLGNATRTRIARGYYKDALKRNLSETEALKEAAFAFNNIAPNFNRVNTLARNANAFLPYFSAGISGARSMWQPILKNPGRAAAVYAGIATTFMGATAYNLSSERGQEFYKDMLKSDKDYVLNNNYVIVLPTAAKDDATGEWTGIIKIPISPEYRYLNEMALGATQQAITGESKLSPTQTALAVFNTMTGGVADSVQQGPMALRVGQILAGAKGRGSYISPDPLVKGYMADLPKEEQQYDWTSNPAKFFSDVTGNKISPIQADELIKQFGTVGRVATGTSLLEQVKGRFSGTYAKSLPSEAYEATAQEQRTLSQTMRDKGGGISGARKIAKDYNKKIDKYIELIEKSNMSEAKKKEEIKRLKDRKASTATYALKSRLEK